MKHSKWLFWLVIIVEAGVVISGLAALGNWVYPYLEQLIAVTHIGRHKGILMLVGVLAPVLAVFIYYYRKICKALGFNFNDMEAHQVARVLPTYALWARLLSWLAIVAQAVYFPDLRELAFIYTIYLIGVVWWSSRDSYHSVRGRTIRAVGDLFLASYACYGFGGVLGPAAILFLIPLTSLARNFSTLVAYCWTTLTVIAILALAYWQSELFQLADWGAVKELFSGSGVKAEAHMVAVYQLNHLVFICATFYLITLILDTEHRRTYRAALMALAEAVSDPYRSIRAFLRLVAIRMDSEIVLLVCGDLVYLALHSRAIHLKRLLHPAKTSVKYACDMAPLVAECVMELDSQRGQERPFDLYNAGSFDQLLELLKRPGVLPEKIGAIKVKSLEICSIRSDACLIALNRYTRNRVAYQNFPAEARYMLRVFGLRAETLWQQLHRVGCFEVEPMDEE